MIGSQLVAAEPNRNDPSQQIHFSRRWRKIGSRDAVYIVTLSQCQPSDFIGSWLIRYFAGSAR